MSSGLTQEFDGGLDFSEEGEEGEELTEQELRRLKRVPEHMTRRKLSRDAMQLRPMKTRRLQSRGSYSDLARRRIRLAEGTGVTVAVDTQSTKVCCVDFEPCGLPRQRGGAPSAPASPVAIRVKQLPRSGRFVALLFVSLAVSVRAPADAAASANVDRPQLSKTASELAPAGFNYTKYVEAQRRKTDAIALSGHTGQWVVKETIQFIAKYVTELLPMTTRFSLCHGTRSGREALWFRESLPGIQVWGTELSPVAAATAPWTMPWDFHTVRPEWRGAADFVYSNALDHSFNASLAVSSWLEELAPGGAILIHWAGGASKATGVHKDTDIFSAGYVRLMEIFSAAGNVTEVVSLPTPKKSWYGGRVRKGQTLFVVQAKVVDEHLRR